jgi:hypothetical protein
VIFFKKSRTFSHYLALFSPGGRILPFQDKKKVGAFLSKKVVQTSAPEVEGPHLEEGMKAAAEDLIHAVHNKDIEAVAAALRAAFEIADSEPHVEGEHIE